MTPGAYRERLRCPWSWYIIGSFASVLIALEVAIVAPGVPPWLIIPVVVAGSVVVVAWIGRRQVVVEDGTLLVRGARLELRYVEGTVPLDAGTMKRLLGRDADPAAFLAISPWVGAGVQILLDDPDDPVPYWAVSTRHPRELAAAMRAQARPSSTTPETGGSV